MKNSFLIAKLTSFDTIRVVLFTEVPKDDMSFVLMKDDKEKITLKLVKQTSMLGISYFTLLSPSLLDLGHKYTIVLPSFGTVPLDVSDVTSFTHFDDDYYYNKDDLGANYHLDYTEFVLWAPLTSFAYVYYFKNDKITVLEMKKEEHGVWRVILEGDHDGLVYGYILLNSGNLVTIPDPYGKGSTLNSKQSVVINFDKLKTNMNREFLPPVSSLCDAIIYETSVRDISIDPTTNIEAKGRFLGMIEENRTTKGGNKAGFDYLTSLGITHLQLLPIYDFATVDEEYPDKKYNWGYDPAQYFVPEGSFASKLNDPYSRIEDLIKLVSSYHKKGIRIIMDVVFNHIYEYQYSILEKCVPNFYFRRKSNEKMWNTSGCGNDIATERKMVRKLIVDACIHWVKTYDIDGFRFDLMGIIDKTTINEIYSKITKIKKDFVMYGEGWNMGGDIPSEERATLDNAFSLPHIGFFNDTFRDSLKGPSFKDKLSESGYALGNKSLLQVFKYDFLGSTIDVCYHPKFLFPSQSINYVECHDNGTLYDKIFATNTKYNENEILELVKFINSLVMISFGVPFFHMGQEIGLTKFGEDNTYNMGDKYNFFNYGLLDARIEMVEFFKGLCQLRKELSFLKINNTDTIYKLVDFKDLDKGGLYIIYHAGEETKPFKNIHLLINPSHEVLYYDFDEYKHVYFAKAGYEAKLDHFVKNSMVAPRSILLLVEK